MWSGCRRIGWNTEVGGATQHVDLMGGTWHALGDTDSRSHFGIIYGGIFF